jgi:hypothetical protein
VPRSVRSKTLFGILWVASFAATGVGAYFGGRGAEAKYEDLITSNEPAPEVKLEDQGRYDEAIQTVLDRRKEGLREANADEEVALIYLNRTKKDWANRKRWAEQVAFYIDKAAALAPKDPFILESAMDDLNAVGDYSDNGCPHYLKAVQFGEAALALLQGNTVTVEGHARSYPTQPIKEGLQPRLKRIRDKIEACCKKAP